MLRSVRDLERIRVTSGEGVYCGRVKDVYFDDQSWAIKYLVAALDPRQFGQKEILLLSEQIKMIVGDGSELQLKDPFSGLGSLPLSSDAEPVCRQYAAMALSSPGARRRGRSAAGHDPYLRSARTVFNYCISVAGEFGGTLTDFIFDGAKWQIRYLAIEQALEDRKIHFHVPTQSVERFTWATQRVLLRDLQPVEIAAGEQGANISSLVA